MKQNLLFRQIALCLCCMILSATALQAQQALKVTGPETKNAKIWDKQQKSTIVNLPL